MPRSAQESRLFPYTTLFRSSTEKTAVPNSAAHDLSQHVSSTLVRGQHAIGDEEGGSASMVSDDSQRGSYAFSSVHEVSVRKFGGFVDKRCKQVCFVV